MPSKLVTDRQKGAEAVMALGSAQGDQLAESVQALLAKVADGQELPGVGLLVQLLSQTLSKARDDMVDADEAHEQELADDPEKRNARDTTASELSARLVELREVVTGLYGAATARAVFSAPTPSDPVVLARFAGEVARQLTTVSLPAPRIAGATLDTAAVAKELGEQQKQLDQCVKEVALEEREAQSTLTAKNTAIADYDRAFRAVATVLTGLFELVGNDELASRVRPSARRPGRTAADDEPEPSPSQATA